MTRRLAVLLLLVVASAAAAKGKIINLKNVPLDNPAKLAALIKASKDQGFRTVASLYLDNGLREKGKEVAPGAEFDQVFGEVLQGVFNTMGAPNDVYTWSKDTNGPRSDMLCEGKILVFPSPTRVTPAFERKYTLTLDGKKLEAAQKKECTVVVSTAKSPEEWFDWTSAKGWGVVAHPVYSLENLARGAVTFYSPGSRSFPFSRLEKPLYVGFAARGAESPEWKLNSVEPPVAADYRKQECNIFEDDPPKGKVSDLEKKLRLMNWMEMVRILNPAHEKFVGTDLMIFSLKGTDRDLLLEADKGLLDPYAKSDSPLVRAAVELKMTEFKVPSAPSVLGDLVINLKSPAVRGEVLKAILKLLGPKFKDAGVPATPEDNTALVKMVTPDPKKPITMRELVIFEDWAKMRVSNQPIDGYLFRKFPDGWQLLGII